ncbi:MAG: glycosyltransferase [Alphaproteobacteria bacterium]|nr:glycosyltransferase [Alphaproteobacteria bacterium]
MFVSCLALCAFASLLAWFWLLLFRGGYWRCDQLLTDRDPEPADWPNIVAVIPARDEVKSIHRAVMSLLNQPYPSSLHIIVVDDNSSDGTADVVAALDDERVEVISGKPLPEMWAGKMWAVAQGVEYAAAKFPRTPYLLLTDADLEHGQDTLSLLVAKAEKGQLDLVSLMVRLRCETLWEALLVPPFVYFFQKLFPFPWVNKPRHKTVAAAGGCMLVRWTALRRVGGISRIRDRVIDDCALAAAIKPGGSIWLGLSETSHSLRGYDQLGGIWDMVARTAFVQLKRSNLLVVLSTIGMMFLYLGPPIVLVLGLLHTDLPAIVFGAAAWSVMAVSIVPTIKLYGMNAAFSVFLPISAALYTAMTISSAWRDHRGKGGAWKGRNYSA